MDKDTLESKCRIAAYNVEQEKMLVDLYEPYLDEYPIDCTGDVCVGDEIVFAEASFTGSYRKPKFSHYEMVIGTVVNDSYGAAKQQHTFTIEKENGSKTCRKGRNVYRILTLRKERDAAERDAVLEEKHARGDAARSAREVRRESEWVEKFGF